MANCNIKPANNACAPVTQGLGRARPIARTQVQTLQFMKAERCLRLKDVLSKAAFHIASYRNAWACSCMRWCMCAVPRYESAPSCVHYLGTKPVKQQGRRTNFSADDVTTREGMHEHNFYLTQRPSKLYEKGGKKGNNDNRFVAAVVLKLKAKDESHSSLPNLNSVINIRWNFKVERKGVGVPRTGVLFFFSLYLGDLQGHCELSGRSLLHYAWGAQLLVAAFHSIKNYVHGAFHIGRARTTNLET